MDLPLHSGRAPPWLFSRMVRLSRALGGLLLEEFGARDFLERLSDPWWFQALSCVLGFDWHSSGTTTVTMGALKEAGLPGLAVVGGKGQFRQLPGEIEQRGEELGLSSRKIERLKRASRMSARADTVGLIDGFSLYHHAMVFDGRGRWTVVQQGMKGSWARRYHLSMVERFDEEPNRAVVCDTRGEVINTVARESREERALMVELAGEVRRYGHAFTGQATLSGEYIRFPRSHWFSTRAYRSLLSFSEDPPEGFEQLMERASPSGMRALALLAELIYRRKVSRRDPVRYSFAHGGKDGVPHPVDREQYDRSIRVLEEILEASELERKEKLGAMKRLSRWLPKA